MLLRQEPTDKEKFLSVRDAILNMELQINGFHPMYYWDKTFYYKDNVELNKFISTWQKNLVERR